MRVLSVYSVRGGSGKSTTACAVSSFLASRANSVILCDSDIQRSSSIGIGGPGFDPDQAPGLWNILKFPDEVGLKEVARETAQPNLRLVPACGRLTEMDLELAQKPGGELRLRRPVKRLREEGDVDYLIFDLNPSASSAINYAILAQTDAVIITVEPSAFGVASVAQTSQLIASLQDLNENIGILGFLFTVVDNTGISQQVIQDVRRSDYGSLCFETVIRRSVAVKLAAREGLPLTVFNESEKCPPWHRNSTAYQDYARLVDEIEARLKEVA